ncbi:MAG TPA: rhomboid-like protein [Mycobacterium sp.]
MAFGVLTALARVRVTMSYAAALAVVTFVLLILGPDAQSLAVRHASTNLHNLSHGHLGTLLDSAFVVDAGPIYIWLPGLVCLLAVFELMYHGVRLIVAFAIGHIGATLMVAAGLTAAVGFGVLPKSVSRADDVGMSYGAVGVLGALSAAIPRRYRAAWVVWWIGVAAAGVLVERDFTAAGHAIALVLGMLLSTRFGPPACWTRARRVLLVVAMGFGFLVLANTVPIMVVAVGLGAPCALVAGWLSAHRNSSADASIQSERHDSGTGASSSSPGISHS